MTIRIPRTEVAKIRDHAARAYPEEGCGFLIGVDGAPRRVLEARPATNAAPGMRGVRYAIEPRETLRLTRALRGTDREILGFYHSHPDHPGEPSEFDRSRAWTWYTYVIVAVVRGAPGEPTAWVLEGPDGADGFRRVPIEEA